MEDNSNYSQPSLPDGILLDILSRLPIKSIHRCKSVCTQFNHWISTPHFTKLHHSHSSTLHLHLQRRRVAVLVSLDPPSSVAIRSVDTETLSDHSLIPLSNDFKYSYPNTRIWNSCNGLVLISISGKTFFVWNPSTGEKELVRCSLNFPYYRYFLLGLGFDRLSNEYKVIGGCQKVSSGNRCLMLVLDGTRTSNEPRIRKIDDFPFRICKDTPGFEVGGDLYWMVNRPSGVPVIVFFDFGAEVFVEMTKQPIWEPGVLKYGLGVLSGSLCVACHGEKNVEVLGFKKCDGVESWVRLFVVSYDAGSMQFKTLMPLCFTKDGEVVMEIDRKSLVVYNLEEKTYRLLCHLPQENKEEGREILRSRQGIRVSGFNVVVYDESLVSPNSASKSIVNLGSTVEQQLSLG